MSDNDKREKVEVYADDLRRAYDKADDNTRVVLDALFGTIQFGGEDGNKPDLKDYKTIRTYEDACVALGERVDEETLKAANVPAHIIAEMKLELVCKALWGGVNNCNPCEDDKVWWYPCMALWTKDEIADKDDEDRVALLSAHAYNGAYAGFGCLYAFYRSSWTDACGGFRLCLDTEEKAEYFGRQFVELWAEYLAYNFKVGGHLE